MESTPSSPQAGIRPASPSWQTLAGIALLLGVATLFTYSNSFSAGLTLDNRVVIGQDPRLKAWTLNNLRLIFTENYWWPSAASDLFRPLTTLSYLVNYSVLGCRDNPAGYHWVNFMLHWANACLVLVVLNRLTGRIRLSGFAAALFAVHPVNVESVTNIVGRADLLATLSILIGGWCYLRSAESGGWRRILWLAGLGIAACAGVLTKESAVMIVVFVGLYDLLWRLPRLGGTTWREQLSAAARSDIPWGWLALVPAVVLLFWARHKLLYTSPVYGQLFVDNPIARATPIQGFLTGIKVIGRYLRLLVLPHTLSCDYSYNQIPLFGDGAPWWEDLEAWIALGVVGGLLWAAVRLWRTAAPFTWGVMFFFITILPTSNLFFPIGSIMGERFLYLPSIGFCLLAALALRPMGAALARRCIPNEAWRDRAALALPAVVVAVFALRAHVRNADWHDDISLWKSAVAACPDSFKTHKGYSNALWDAGRNETAIDAAIARIEIGLGVLDQRPLPEERRDNTLFHDLGMYYRIKGEFVARRGDAAEARRFFEKSVAILSRGREVDRWVDDESHRASIKRGRRREDLADVGNPKIYWQLGLALVQLGRWSEAEEAGRYIQRLAPAEVNGYMLVGAALFPAGHPDKAAVQTMTALVLQPLNEEAWINLERCYRAMKLDPVPITQNGSAHGLDMSNAVVGHDLVEACAMLVRNMEEARQIEQARAFRAMVTTQYHVPPEALGDGPSSRPPARL